MVRAAIYQEDVLFGTLHAKIQSIEAPVIAFLLETGKLVAYNAYALHYFSVGANEVKSFRVVPEKMDPQPLLAQRERYTYLRLARLCMALRVKGQPFKTAGEAIVLRIPARESSERLYICSLSERFHSLQDLFSSALLDSMWQMRQLDETRIARQLLDNLPGMVYWKDRTLRIRGCNALYARRYRMIHGEIIGKTQNEIEPDKVVAAHSERVDRDVLETGQRVYNSFEPYVWGGNRIDWVRTQRIPIKNENEETVGVLCWIEDATEEMAHNLEIAKLKERVELLESLVSTAVCPMASWVETDEGIQTAYVSESISCLGVDFRTFKQNRPWFDIVHPDDRDFIMSEWRRLARKQDEFTLQYRIIDDSRMVRPIMAHMRTFRNAAGIVVRYEGALEEV